MLSPKDFTQIADPRLRLLLEHWLAVRGSRTMPARQDIDPARIVAALPLIWILEYHRATGLFRFRLAGEEVRALYGRDLRGLSYQSVFPAREHPAVLARIRRVVDGPCVMHARGAIYGAAGRTGEGERLALPLAADGTTPDAVIGASIYRWGDRLALPRRQPQRHEMIVTFTAVEGTGREVEGAANEPVTVRWD